ncbi:MAG: acyl-[acyl-carrier-protein] thioesterase [Ilumatobacter sp.]
MASPLPAIELLHPPEHGRVFTMDAKVRLGDVDRDGYLRLDATARYLQDVATDDASDAGLDRRYGWLVRRMMIDAAVPAGLGEELRISTWCSAIGRAWAERRTRLVGSRGARIDAVGLWVQIDTESGRPARVASDFTDAYGATAAGRTVSARMSLGVPPSSEWSPAWHPRAVDIDPMGHVNNAATWAFLEEYAAFGDRRGRAEIEYLRPIEPGADLGVLFEGNPRAVDEADAAGLGAWLLDDSGVTTAARWTPTS